MVTTKMNNRKNHHHHHLNQVNQVIEVNQVKNNHQQKNRAVIWHNRPTAHISCLYPEILAMIFGYLDVKDKGRVAQVCSSWREACYRKSVWKGVEAKIHIITFCPEDNLYKSLVRRGIKQVQVRLL